MKARHCVELSDTYPRLALFRNILGSQLWRWTPHRTVTLIQQTSPHMATVGSAAVIDVAEQALNFGAIQRGVKLDNAQTRIVNNTVGKDISSTLYSQGWFLYIPTQSGSARIERDLKGVIFYYVDGQLIQSITMSSTAIL